MLFRKSSLLQMQWMSRLLQSATLEPDVYCATQGFCKGDLVRMQLASGETRGAYGTGRNTVGGADAKESCYCNEEGGTHVERWRWSCSDGGAIVIVVVKFALPENGRMEEESFN